MVVTGRPRGRDLPGASRSEGHCCTSQGGDLARKPRDRHSRPVGLQQTPESLCASPCARARLRKQGQPRARGPRNTASPCSPPQNQTGGPLDGT